MTELLTKKTNKELRIIATLRPKIALPIFSVVNIEL